MNAGSSCSSHSSVNLDLLHQDTENDFLCSLEKFCVDNGDSADCYLAGKPPPCGEIPFVSRQLLSHSPLLVAICKFKSRIVTLHSFGYRRPFIRVCPQAKAVCDLLLHCVDKEERNVFGDLYRNLQELEEYLANERINNGDDIVFDSMIGKFFEAIATCITASIHSAVIARETAIEEGYAECLVTPAALKRRDPDKIGFPFIVRCDPETETLVMSVKGPNRDFIELPMRIRGKERWHYVKQFYRAKTNRITLVPYKDGKAVELYSVFRHNRGYDHELFYSYTRTTGGSKPLYWLERCRLKKDDLKRP